MTRAWGGDERQTTCADFAVTSLGIEAVLSGAARFAMLGLMMSRPLLGPALSLVLFVTLGGAGCHGEDSGGSGAVPSAKPSAAADDAKVEPLGVGDTAPDITLALQD